MERNVLIRNTPYCQDSRFIELEQWLTSSGYPHQVNSVVPLKTIGEIEILVAQGALESPPIDGSNIDSEALLALLGKFPIWPTWQLSIVNTQIDDNWLKVIGSVSYLNFQQCTFESCRDFPVNGSCFSLDNCSFDDESLASLLKSSVFFNIQLSDPSLAGMNEDQLVCILLRGQSQIDLAGDFDAFDQQIKALGWKRLDVKDGSLQLVADYFEQTGGRVPKGKDTAAFTSNDDGQVTRLKVNLSSKLAVELLRFRLLESLEINVKDLGLIDRRGFSDLVDNEACFPILRELSLRGAREFMETDREKIAMFEKILASPQLRVLLIDSPLPDFCMQKVLALPELEELGLGEAGLTDKLAKELANLKRLKVLSVLPENTTVAFSGKVDPVFQKWNRALSKHGAKFKLRVVSEPSLLPNKGKLDERELLLVKEYDLGSSSDERSDEE